MSARARLESERGKKARRQWRILGLDIRSVVSNARGGRWECMRSNHSGSLDA